MEVEELTVTDELDRKTIEALTRIASEHSRSLMTTREARLAIRAVFETAQGLVGHKVSEMLNVAMSQFSDETKKPLFPLHLKMRSGVVLFVNICLENNLLSILNTSTGEWQQPVVCDTSEETLKKALLFVRGALEKGAVKL